jgi:hypothetical protein
VNARLDSEEAQQELLQTLLFFGRVATGVEHQSSRSASTSTTIIHKPNRQRHRIEKFSQTIRDYLLAISIENVLERFQGSFRVETQGSIRLLRSTIEPSHRSRFLADDRV